MYTKHTRILRLARMGPFERRDLLQHIRVSAFWLVNIYCYVVVDVVSLCNFVKSFSLKTGPKAAEYIVS